MLKTIESFNELASNKNDSNRPTSKKKIIVVTLIDLILIVIV